MITLIVIVLPNYNEVISGGSASVCSRPMIIGDCMKRVISGCNYLSVLGKNSC